MTCPTCRARKAQAGKDGGATRKVRTVAGLAWSIAWRERNRPKFDDLEARGTYAPERFG